MASDHGRNIFVAYGGVLIFNCYTRDKMHTPIVTDRLAAGI
jgi:hypothetical protein